MAELSPEFDICDLSNMRKHDIFKTPPKEAIDSKIWTEMITSSLEIFCLDPKFEMGPEKEIRHLSIHLFIRSSIHLSIHSFIHSFSYPLIRQIMIEGLLCIWHCTRHSASIGFPFSCCHFLFLINASSFILLCKCWQEWVKKKKILACQGQSV